MEEMEVRDSTNPNDMLFDVEVKVTGKERVKRILYWVAWVVGSLVLLAILVYLLPALIMLTAAILPGVIFLSKHFYKYFCPGYRYQIEKGVLKLYLLYGKTGSGKRLVTVALKDMEIIAPYNKTEPEFAKYREMANDSSIAVRYEAPSSMDHPDVYFCIFDDEEKGRSIMFLEATNKFVKIAKFYNGENTVVSQVSR